MTNMQQLEKDIWDECYMGFVPDEEPREEQGPIVEDE